MEEISPMKAALKNAKKSSEYLSWTQPAQRVGRVEVLFPETLTIFLYLLYMLVISYWVYHWEVAMPIETTGVGWSFLAPAQCRQST